MSGFAMALALLPFSYHVERRLETAVHIKGAESEKVDQELAQRFQSPYADRLILAISGLPDADGAAGAEALGFLTTSLKSVPGVAGAVSSVDWPDPLFTGNNGGALIIVGVNARGAAVEALVPQLRTKADWMEGQLKAQYPNIKLQITGETPLNFDLRKVSADDVRHAEEKAMPVTLLLLLLAFGSMIAALLPLGVGVLSISMALGAAALLSSHLHLSILVQNLATMLGLGLGIDYALLMVSRFREALAEGCDPGCAADLAGAQAGKTLLISATTVSHWIFSAAYGAYQRIALHWNRRLARYRFERHALHVHFALDIGSRRPSYQLGQGAASGEAVQDAGKLMRTKRAVGAVGQHRDSPSLGSSADRRASATCPCLSGAKYCARTSGP